MMNRRPLSVSVRWMFLFASVVAGSVYPGVLMAGGIQLYEVGTNDVGLASAGYGARAQDASTVLTNPAGMTRLEGGEFLFGAQALYGDLALTIGDGTSPQLGTGDGGNPVGWFPGGSAFFTQTLSDKFTVGFGLAGNFGLSEKYDSDWVGRYYIQEATLLGVSLLPSVAYKVNDKLSFGASVNVMYGIFDQQVAVNNIGGADGQLELKDNRWGWGINVGVLYQPSADLRLGLTYNSEVDLDFAPHAQFSELSSGLDTVLGNRGFLNARTDIGIRVPQGYMASMYAEASDRWAVLGSVGWQQWSHFGEVTIGVDSNNPTSLTTDIDFKDTWHGAVGAQYKINEPWLLNFGVAYDSAFQSETIVSPALPANSAYRFGVGAEVQTSKTVAWGFAAEYAYGGSLDVNEQSSAPVALGGRGNLVGSYNDTGIFFLVGNLDLKF